MSDIVLVHGSGHGAWCFRDLIPALEALGHSVTAIDLPGHGENPRPLQDITLDLYRDAILEHLSEDTILLGHSMGGFPITAAALAAPEKIAHLIYLCAYVPQPNKSLVDLRKEAPRQPLLDAIERTADGLGFTVRPEMTEQVFYHDCPAGTVDYANARLCPQAIKPQSTVIDGLDKIATVRKSYIICRNDQTIPPEYQDVMAQAFPSQRVYEMNTGHSPFFADPIGLARLVNTISEDI